MKCTLSLMNNFVFIFMVIYNIKYGVNLKFPHHIHYYNQGLLKSQSLSFPIYSLGLYLTLSFSTIYLSMNSMDFIEIKRIERVEKKYYLNHIHLRKGVMWRQEKKISGIFNNHESNNCNFIKMVQEKCIKIHAKRKK